MKRLRPESLARRFFMGIVAVAATAMATTWAVGALVAPPLFHDHLHDALPSVSTAVLVEADTAFVAANAIALGVSVLTALGASVAASVLLTRRLSRSMAPLSAAAAEVAAGRYDVRIHGNRLGTEFDDLVGAFNDMAARLQHTEAIRSRLLADVAHEMRTPAATLRAYVEGLQDGVAELDDSTAAMLVSQTVRLTRLAEDMAAASGVDEFAPSMSLDDVDPAALVAAAATAARGAFDAKGVALTVQNRTPLPAVRADASRLGQVLSNLLENALRHTPAGGAVTVVASVAGDGVELVVRDTGDGIAPEHLGRIFDRFYRVEASRSRGTGGSGIGLSIARSLVEAQGGRITAQSAGPGLGTTFTVVLKARD